jgi:hypothetical protein
VWWEVNRIGQQEVLILNFNFPSYLQAGVYHWKVPADTDGEIKEKNDRNNTMSGQVNGMDLYPSHRSLSGL